MSINESIVNDIRKEDQQKIMDLFKTIDGLKVEIEANKQEAHRKSLECEGHMAKADLMWDLVVRWFAVGASVAPDALREETLKLLKEG